MARNDEVDHDVDLWPNVGLKGLALDRSSASKSASSTRCRAGAQSSHAFCPPSLPINYVIHQKKQWCGNVQDIFSQFYKLTYFFDLWVTFGNISYDTLDYWDQFCSIVDSLGWFTSLKLQKLLIAPWIFPTTSLGTFLISLEPYMIDSNHREYVQSNYCWCRFVDAFNRGEDFRDLNSKGKARVKLCALTKPVHVMARSRFAPSKTTLLQTASMTTKADRWALVGIFKKNLSPLQGSAEQHP